MVLMASFVLKSPTLPQGNTHDHHRAGDCADSGDLGLGLRMGVRRGSGALSPELSPKDTLSGGGDTTPPVCVFFMLCSP